MEMPDLAAEAVAIINQHFFESIGGNAETAGFVLYQKDFTLRHLHTEWDLKNTPSLNRISGKKVCEKTNPQVAFDHGEKLVGGSDFCVQLPNQAVFQKQLGVKLICHGPFAKANHRLAEDVHIMERRFTQETVLSAPNQEIVKGGESGFIEMRQNICGGRHNRKIRDAIP